MAESIQDIVNELRDKASDEQSQAIPERAKFYDELASRITRARINDQREPSSLSGELARYYGWECR